MYASGEDAIQASFTDNANVSERLPVSTSAMALTNISRLNQLSRGHLLLVVVHDVPQLSFHGLTDAGNATTIQATMCDVQVTRYDHRLLLLTISWRVKRNRNLKMSLDNVS